MQLKQIISLGGKKEIIVRLFVLISIFSFSINSFSGRINKFSGNTECENCFNASVLEVLENEGCLSIQLQIKANGYCSFALSHLSVEIPCGEINDVSNSEGWKMEIPSNDPTTGIKGFKIDDISDFGEDGAVGSFLINFTICSDDECLSRYKNSLKLAYKAGQCIFYEELKLEGEMSAKLNVTNVSCYGGNNGSIAAVVEGGVKPYSFLWSNGSNSDEISGLTAGNYNVLITDSLGEQIVLEASLSQPILPIVIEPIVKSATCASNDGSIKLSESGGNENYTYRWSNGSVSRDLSELYAGTYSVQVFDSAGCYINKTIQVTEDSDLGVVLIPNFLNCHEEGQGEVLSKVEGGTLPYSYVWSNGDTLSTLTGIHSGSYSLSVTDSNGCAASASTYVGIRKMSLTSSVTNPTCNGGSDGEISIIDVYYGNEPYSYLWDNGDTTSTITNLEAGRYKVTVTDVNGCEVTRTINLADRQALNFSHSVAPRDCSSDSIAEISIIGVGGMPPYKYFIEGEEVEWPLQIQLDMDFEITMKDALGCEITKSIVVNGLQGEFNLDALVSQPACGGSNLGSANLTISGGSAPYSISWSDGVTIMNREDLLPGSYYVEVVDSNGCNDSTSFTIDSAQVVSAQINYPTNQISCHSEGNSIYATSQGATTYTWEITNDSYYIENSTIGQLVFTSGTGETSIIYSVMNNDGCLASDTLVLDCYSDDSSDGDDQDSVMIDPDWDDECISGCMYANVSKVTPLSNNCYQFEILISTNGFCSHELSHLTIGLEYATVNWVNNSEDWSVEKNFTDPQTGLYGFKIDNINNFGQSGKDEFKIAFEACFNHPENPEYLPKEIPVVFKASNCYGIQPANVLSSNELKGEITASVFPNPFKEKLNVTVLSKRDTEVTIEFFDLAGSRIELVYQGQLLANIEYIFDFTAPKTSDRIFFYKITSMDNVIQGKVIRK